MEKNISNLKKEISELESVKKTILIIEESNKSVYYIEKQKLSLERDKSLLSFEHSRKLTTREQQKQQI